MFQLLFIFFGIIFCVTDFTVVLASDLQIPQEIEFVTENQIPYHVTIKKQSKYTSDFNYCGGSIISSKLVLTSGSCDAIFGKNITIRSGSNYKNEGGNVRQVKEVIEHPKFSSHFSDFSNDVALVVVDPPFNIDNKKEKIIKLANKDETIDVGEKALITGMAQTKNGTKLDQLMSMIVTVSDHEECNRRFLPSFIEAAKDKFCALHPVDNTDVCVGNIGSAVVIGNRQAGIVSTNPGTCMDLPGIYTKISNHWDWIDEKIKMYP